MSNEAESNTGEPPSTLEQRYARLIQALGDTADVTLGASGKRGFGASALCIDNKIFAMLSSKNEFVVKLPRQRVNALVTSGSGARFDPGHGRLMKEWLVVRSTADEDW